MPCTLKKTVELIVEQGNDYLIAVKKNQPKLFNSLESAFNTQTPLSESTSRELAHGRQTERCVKVLEPPAEIDPKWVGLQRVIKVERHGTRGTEPYSETMFYMSSLQLEAQGFADMIRRHWHVENRLHWPKDVVLKEDSTPTCAGKAILTLAIVRTIAVNLFRAEGHQSITEAIDLFAHDIHKLLSFFQ